MSDGDTTTRTIQVEVKSAEFEAREVEVTRSLCVVCDNPLSSWMLKHWDVLRSKLHPMAYLEFCRFALNEGLPHPNEQPLICEHCFIELSFGIANWNPIVYASEDVVTITSK